MSFTQGFLVTWTLGFPDDFFFFQQSCFYIPVQFLHTGMTQYSVGIIHRLLLILHVPAELPELAMHRSLNNLHVRSMHGSESTRGASANLRYLDLCPSSELPWSDRCFCGKSRHSCEGILCSEHYVVHLFTEILVNTMAIVPAIQYAVPIYLIAI